MLSAEEYKKEGNRLAALKQYDKALAQYELATRSDPKLAAAWLNKGLMLKTLDKTDLAIPAFEQALAINPTYHKAKINLANCHLKLANYGKAWPLLHACLTTSFKQDAQIGILRCQQHLAANVIFANVDLKLTSNNQVKILEFGNGLQSGFLGYQQLTGTSMQALFKEKLQQLIQPTYINSIAGIPDSDAAVDEAIAQLGLEDLDEIPTSLEHYQALYAGNSLRPTSNSVLKLDGPVIQTIFEEKSLTHQCFVESAQLDARPQTMRLPRVFQQDLASKILNAFPHTATFVLKIPNEERGKGVLIVSRQDLEPSLRVLLLNDSPSMIKKESSRFAQYLMGKLKTKPSDPLAYFMQVMDPYITWSELVGHEFMVEAYTTSKAYKHHNKLYDGTVRVAFMLVRDQGNFQFIPLASYWKLPPKPINEGNLRERTVSSFNEEHKSSALVSRDDEAIIYAQLSTLLPKVFSTMMTFDLEAYISKAPESTDKEKYQKASQWMHYANSLLVNGYHHAADHYLERARKLTPHDSKYYHQLGVHLHEKQAYDDAIQAFNTAAQKNPRNSATFYRRALTWLAKDELAAAQHDFQKCVELNPSYQQIVQFKLENYQRVGRALK